MVLVKRASMLTLQLEMLECKFAEQDGSLHIKRCGPYGGGVVLRPIAPAPTRVDDVGYSGGYCWPIGRRGGRGGRQGPTVKTSSCKKGHITN